MFFTTVYAFGAAISSMGFGILLSYEKIPFRAVLTFAALCQLASYLLWAFAQNLIMVYIAGFLIAASMQGIKIIGTSVCAVNWFDPSVRGTLIGTSACFQGIGGTVWPIAIQLIINTSGYQAGYFLLIGITLVLVLPFTLFVFDRKPQDKGYLPLGYGLVTGKEQMKDENKFGMSLSKAMKTIPFWIFMIVVFALGMQNGFKSNFSGIALEGLGAVMAKENIAMVAALMVSIASAFDFIGNVSIGFLVDRIGPLKGAYVALGIFACFFIVLLLLQSSVWAFYVAAACFGFNGSILRTPIPLSVREVFGTKHFGSIWGTLNAVKPWASGVMATCIALVFDITGTYSGILIFGLCFTLSVFILYAIAVRWVGKFDWNKEAAEATADAA